MPMLCSSCSQVVRPVVAIDIDGTLGDYHGHFSEFAQAYLNRPLSQLRVWETYRGDEPYKDWFQRTFGVDHSTFRQVKLAYRQGGMKRVMPMIPGASALVNGLMSHDVEVWLTTTRPHDRFDRVDPDTREWLARHRIRFDGLLYSGRKMEELSDRIDPGRVVAVLDDQINILDRVEDLGWTGIMKRSIYNQKTVWLGYQAETLPRAYDIITMLLEQWRKKNS